MTLLSSSVEIMEPKVGTARTVLNDDDIFVAPLYQISAGLCVLNTDFVNSKDTNTSNEDNRN